MGIGNNTLSKTQQQRKIIPKIDKWNHITLKISHQQRLCQSEQTASGKRQKLSQYTLDKVLTYRIYKESKVKHTEREREN